MYAAYEAANVGAGERRLPPILTRAFGWGKARATHALSGGEYRSEEEVKRICAGDIGEGISKCEHFHNGACYECGCPTSDEVEVKWKNKVNVKTQHCPINKW